MLFFHQASISGQYRMSVYLNTDSVTGDLLGLFYPIVV